MAMKPKGRAIGAAARAAALTGEERKKIASDAAKARWGLKATHKGSFKEEFGIEVECYVLDDAQKTGVISQRGMGEALGFQSGGGAALPRFVSSQRVAPYVGAELREKLDNPINFQIPGTVLNMPGESRANGYDVTILIDVCHAIIRAEQDGKLQERHANIARQAHIIVNASAKLGIKMLVYALAGYKPENDAVIQAWKSFVQEEARKYEQEFPNDLYLAWQRLYQIPMPARGKPWQFMHLTRRHVYYPLAKSQGKILDLLRALRAKAPEQSRYLFTFLNEIGARALRIHIGRLLEMAESSPDRVTYENKIAERFGGQHELNLVVPDGAGEQQVS